LLCFSEPDDYESSIGESILNGQQIGDDFVILRHVLDQYSFLKDGSVIGPDIGGPFNRRAPDIVSGLVMCKSDAPVFL
jgi:hypothetical protein